MQLLDKLESVNGSLSVFYEIFDYRPVYKVITVSVNQIIPRSSMHTHTHTLTNTDKVFFFFTKSLHILVLPLGCYFQ